MEYLSLALSIAFLVTLLMGWFTRGIAFFATDTNNEHQIRSAASVHKWRWPSDMHKNSGSKTRMKDAGVLGVVFFQRVFNDRYSEYPLIFLCNLACSLSAIFTYLVVTHYWDEKAGLLIFAFFLFSFWPHQITLQGTYQCLALFFLLFGIFCLQRGLFLVSGASFGLMMFSSAATRKFLPLMVGAFLHHFWVNGNWVNMGLWMGTGFTAIFLFFTAPDFIKNLKEYWSWWRNSKNACHFILYKKYFDSIEKPISDDMRGAGWKWVFLFFFSMAPFVFIGFFVSLGLDAYAWITRGMTPSFLWQTAGILFLSISPLVYGEMTKAPQLGRSYFPGFSGLLVFIAYSVYHFEKGLSLTSQATFWKCVLVYFLLSFLWNAWIFLSDVWPARMAATWLGNRIKHLGLTKIYTYNTHFNLAFVDTLHPCIKKNCAIQFIRSLAEVDKEGYVAVPGISAKAFNMENYPEGIDNKDFEDDPLLVRLIDSKKIRESAVASFKTFGTSKVWVHESEMPTYRALILKDITKQDLWRGRAWLLYGESLARSLKNV